MPARFCTIWQFCLGLFCSLALLSISAEAAKFVPNYDEAKVPEYTLPDPLIDSHGKPVTDAKTWTDVRRPEILALFEKEIYGKAPGRPEALWFETALVDPDALDGRAVRKEVVVHFTKEANGPSMRLMLYLPKNAKGPVPAFLALNFFGNHSIHPDPKITLSDRWMRSNKKKGIKNHRATEASRGTSQSRWPVEKILDRGYALATIYYGDIDPDFNDGFQNGIHPHFYREGQTRPDPDQWGSISAWAWGLSRAMDYLETDPGINSRRVAVMGHSRLGKTSLWAGATDERFALVISNDSGCGGAALSRRKFGETYGFMKNVIGYWFCENWRKYADREDEMPVDQHMLIALMAPRPVYVASAVEDRWADPKGEFLSTLHASGVYELFGLKGVSADTMPEVDQPADQGTIGYHVRQGRHNVTDFDWNQYLNFFDKLYHTEGLRSNSGPKSF